MASKQSTAALEPANSGPAQGFPDLHAIRQQGPLLLLAVALLTGLVLRYDAADHPYLSQWDEAYHALVAKNLQAHPLVPTLYDVPVLDYDYRDWGGNHIWLHKPPLALWLMALAMTVSGEEELVLRLPSVLLGTLAILCTYLIATTLWGQVGRVVGAVAALLQSLNPLGIRLVSGTIPTDHTDVALVFFVELTVLLYVLAARTERHLFAALAGAALGLGYLTKTAPAAVGLLTALPLLWMGRARWRTTARLLTVSLAAFAVTALPWFIYTAQRWPREFTWESGLAFARFGTALEGHEGSIRFYLDLLPEQLGGPPLLAQLLLAASVIYGLVSAVRERDRGLAAILLWAFLPYALLSLIPTKVTAYIAPAIPALLLLVGRAAAGLMTLARVALERDGAARGALFVGVAAGGLLLAVHVSTVAIERFSADYGICPWNVLYDCPDFRRTMLEIKGKPGARLLLLNVGDGKVIHAMFYTGGTAYDRVPEPETVRTLLDRGFTVYLVLDARHTNAERVEALARAGLNERVRAVAIGPPRAVPVKSPYQN